MNLISLWMDLTHYKKSYHLYKLYHGDCLEKMDQLIQENIKFDAIITDPPYGTTACKWDCIIPLKFMWEKLKVLRKEKTPIILFGSEPFSSYLRISNIEEYKYDWIWNKKKAGNIFSLKYSPYKIHEIISIFYRHNYYPIMEQQKERKSKTYGIGRIFVGGNYGNEIIYNEKNPKSIIEISNASQKNKLHSTQKPLTLMEYLIKTYTKENNLILDFTMGSGTTGEAALKLNRNFIGIEIEEESFKIAEHRIRMRAKFEKRKKEFNEKHDRTSHVY